MVVYSIAKVIEFLDSYSTFGEKFMETRKVKELFFPKLNQVLRNRHIGTKRVRVFLAFQNFQCFFEHLLRGDLL
jgi:hypothetical protein